MGCGGGKDAKATVYDQILSKTVQTNIIEFDQIFLVMAEVLQEAEDIRQNVIPSRVNMIQISKASLISNPTLIDAYKLWTWAVSACNKGETTGLTNILSGVKYEFNEEKHSFEYKLGKCGECKLDWFGDFLNDYISGVHRAKDAFPAVKEKVQNMFDRIKGMKMQIFGYLAPFQGNEKWMAIGKVGVNMASLGRGVQVADEFQKHLEEYEREVKQLFEQHKQIEEEADEKGKKIYEEYGILPVEKSAEDEPERFKLKEKMNKIVRYYYGGTSRTLEEQKQYDEIKAERAKGRPRRNKDYRHDDRGREGKEFPYRLRWTGCNALDLPIGEMSMALEDLNVQLTKAKRIRNLIRFHTQTYLLKDDNMTEAWRVFTWALAAEHGDLKAKKLEIKDDGPCIAGLDKLKCKDPINEEVRQLFLEWWPLCPPYRIDVLNAGWQKFNDNFGTLIPEWSQGEFTNFSTFKSAKAFDQYNIMTNLAKNIYALKEYRPKAKQIYEKNYIKRQKECEETFKNGNDLIEAAKDKASEAKGKALKDLIALHQGERKNEEDVQKRLTKINAAQEAHKQQQKKK